MKSYGALYKEVAVKNQGVIEPRTIYLLTKNEVEESFPHGVTEYIK